MDRPRGHGWQHPKSVHLDAVVFFLGCKRTPHCVDSANKQIFEITQWGALRSRDYFKSIYKHLISY